MKSPEPQPATGKEWDRPLPPRQRPAAARHNCRNCHTPGRPGCSMTTLNRRERPIQGHASQSRALRKAISGVSMWIRPSLVPVRMASLNASIELRTAIGIAGAVLLHRANIDALGAQHFGPTDRCRQKMCVAEGDIGHRNFVANFMLRRVRDGDMLSVSAEPPMARKNGVARSDADGCPAPRRCRGRQSARGLRCAVHS